MSHRPTRRQALGLIGGGAVAAGIGWSLPWLGSPAETGRLLRSRLPLPRPFTVALPLPLTKTPVVGRDHDLYELSHRVSTVEILPGVHTEIWGYDGTFPGPTIVSRSGRRTVVRHHNQLPVPTVVHLHGGHTPQPSDGYPTDLILPVRPGHEQHPEHEPAMSDPEAVTKVGTRVYDYPMRQRAATLWYHDHRMDFTGPDVWRGLAGFHLVHDAEEDSLPLPRGDRDVPLMLADRAFDADGAFRYPSRDGGGMDHAGVTASFGAGVFGDVILVNGAPWPVLEVDQARYRLRILNGSNARRYRLALDHRRSRTGDLVQVGSDGGLLERPVRHHAIDIAPAERFDVVVDFSRYPVGSRVTLLNRLDTGGPGRVMQFHVVRRARDDSAVPSRLSELERLDPDTATTTRDFAFGNRNGTWTVNGEPFTPARDYATPRLGDTEIWRFTTDFHHPIHLHLAHFQVISRNGGEPGAYDAGWKDTVDLRPAEAAAVVVRFTDYRGRFVLHCHNLEHEDMAMMANFRTT